MLPSGGVVRLSMLLEAVQGEVAPQRPIRRCSMSDSMGGRAWTYQHR